MSRIGNPSRRSRHFIREWREFRGLSQQELADLVGASKTAISNIENLKAAYTQDSLEAIADALGVHPTTLLTRIPTPADATTAPFKDVRRAVELS